MKLTKKQALQKCSKMWHWLAENPKKEKWDYFKEHHLHSYVVSNGCYLCEQAMDGCDDCLLKDFWPKYKYGCLCEGETSPYVLWCKGISRDSNALAIAEAADEALKKLEVKYANQAYHSRQ